MVQKPPAGELGVPIIRSLKTKQGKTVPGSFRGKKKGKLVDIKRGEEIRKKKLPPDTRGFQSLLEKDRKKNTSRRGGASVKERG